SPSNFNYRKGNELLTGGLSSMKSAAISLSKKYNEIRGTMNSASGTPIKGSIYSLRMGDEGDDESLDGSSTSSSMWGRRESADVMPGIAPLDDPGGPMGALLGGMYSESDGVSSQGDLFPPLGWDTPGPYCLGVWLTSCTRCHNCQALLYDEEIMAGWRPDDSNLNTKCAFCDKMTVPMLTINIYDLRHLPRPDKNSEDAADGAKQSTETLSDNIDRALPDESQDKNKVEKKPNDLLKDDTGANIKRKGERLEALQVPYLSPLVLRKELETVLFHEGDTCLTQPAFADHHPILYWNMLWYFSRLRVPSHLFGLCLGVASVTKDRLIDPSWEGADWKNVYIKCLWDNVKYHEELGEPMYLQWRSNSSVSPLVSALVHERTKVPRDIIQSVITAVHVDDLATPLRLMLQELRKRPANLRKNHYPLYRDLLFLATSCIPSPQLNLTSFDREYRRAYEQVEPGLTKLLSRYDAPPPIAAVFCRRYFSHLTL
ncbi:unnamed protein product, partial [Meganyctiphanes norvegica]